MALLRGINVLGRNKVAMTDLRDVVSALGHEEVTTYIQSGNVVFAAAVTAAGSISLADTLEAAIAAKLGVRSTVVVVSRAQLHKVASTNPFPQVADPKTLHAVFLRETPNAEGIEAVRAAVMRARDNQSRHDAQVIGQTLYLWTPDGIAASVLRRELDRRGKLTTPMRTGTARNWSTVKALVNLLDE